MTERVREATGESPACVLPDAGYWHTAQIMDARWNDIEVLVQPDSLQKRRKYSSELTETMRTKLEQAASKAIDRLRQSTVEPGIARIKEGRGFHPPAGPNATMHLHMLRPLLVPLLLYVLACCHPALEWTKAGTPNDVMLGLRALAVGWSGIFAGVFAWFANPFWLAALLLAGFRKPMWALAPALIAIAISFTVYQDIGRELPGDEGGVTKTTIIKLLPGCYVWFASLISLPIAAIAEKLMAKTPTAPAVYPGPV